MWKVGALASRTGLTVRTLHHYDHIGLVRPSGRTAAGHRLYNEDDVQRLYQVLALRQLGLSLDRVLALMQGEVAARDVFAAHEQFLGEQLETLAALRSRVGGLASSARDLTTSVDDFLDTIKKVIEMDSIVTKYFSDEQLATLEQRRGSVDEGAIGKNWAELISEVSAAIDSGMDPASNEAKALAARWMALLEGFHGGDEGLRDSLYRMQEENADQIEQEHGGPSNAQIEFIAAANRARGV